MREQKIAAALLEGAKAGLPVLFGYIPAGMAYAILAEHAGFGAGSTILMSLTVFAGASQMMAAGLVEQGAAVVTIVLATFILNLRHVIMSTCVMKPNRREPASFRALAAFGVTDETFAIFTTRPSEKATLPYFLGLAAVSYSGWIGGTVLGCAAARLLPDLVTASLGIALYAMFLGLLVPHLKKNARLTVLVLLTAGISWLCNQFFSASWSIIAATLAGAGIGLIVIPQEETADLAAELVGEGEEP